MNLVFVAHEQKKELLVRFCELHLSELAEHRLISTAATGKYISALTGLPFQLSLSSINGGLEQIASKIAYNEIDLLFFFRNPSLREDPDGQALLRIADLHNVPTATNFATADILIEALKRGEIPDRRHAAPYDKFN